VSESSTAGSSFTLWSAVQRTWITLVWISTEKCKEKTLVTHTCRSCKINRFLRYITSVLGVGLIGDQATLTRIDIYLGWAISGRNEGDWTIHRLMLQDQATTHYRRHDPRWWEYPHWSASFHSHHHGKNKPEGHARGLTLYVRFEFLSFLFWSLGPASDQSSAADKRDWSRYAHQLCYIRMRMSHIAARTAGNQLKKSKKIIVLMTMGA
jgi:hypothetical protein